MKSHEFDFEHLGATPLCEECEAHADMAQRMADRRNRQWAIEARFGIQPTRTRP